MRGSRVLHQFVVGGRRWFRIKGRKKSSDGLTNKSNYPMFVWFMAS